LRLSSRVPVYHRQSPLSGKNWFGLLAEISGVGDADLALAKGRWCTTGGRLQLLIRVGLLPNDRPAGAAALAGADGGRAAVDHAQEADVLVRVAVVSA
jgi:hypothetical protein